jgi:hypothetical protein
LAKLGPGKEGSFTSVLISRVCLVKTLKTLKLPELKVANEKWSRMRKWGALVLFFTPASNSSLKLLIGFLKYFL